jgi:site-specific recombinase XerD
VEYVRNGGDVLTLQKILGHTTLAMVRVSVDLAKKDVARMHSIASPGDNLDLGAFKQNNGLNQKPKRG